MFNINQSHHIWLSWENSFCDFSIKKYIIVLLAFFTKGEPISRHRLRCSLFDVDYYAFTGRFLVHPFNARAGWVGLDS